MAKKTQDRRIQRTRKLLQDALLSLILEKGYEAVTVQDVIDRANVGRSTFYAHFQDKEDLLLSGFEHLRTQLEEHLRNKPGTVDSPWTLSLSMFQHAQEYRRVYKAFVGEKGSHTMLGHAQKYLMAFIGEHLKTQTSPKKKGKIPLEILTFYIVNTLTALMAWWLDNDVPYSAEQMNDYYRQLVQPEADAILRQR